MACLPSRRYSTARASIASRTGISFRKSTGLECKRGWKSFSMWEPVNRYWAEEDPVQRAGRRRFRELLRNRGDDHRYRRRDLRTGGWPHWHQWHGAVDQTSGAGQGESPASRITHDPFVGTDTAVTSVPKNVSSMPTLSALHDLCEKPIPAPLKCHSVGRGRRV